MSVHVPLSRAIFVILGSTALISGSAAFALLYSLNFQAARMVDPKYTVTAVVQACCKGTPLPTTYLTELLELSIDQPVNLYQIHLEEAEKRLLASPIISSAEVKRAPPSTLFITYSTRIPIAYVADVSNTAIDSQGVAFPFKPFLQPTKLPLLYYSGHVEWGKPLTGQSAELALKLIALLNSKWGGSVRLVDVSSVDAPSQGKRQIVGVIDDHILRLSPAHFEKELADYQELKKIKGIDARVIDFRIPQLAYISTKGEFVMQFIEIQCTYGSIDEARKISRYLVQERLVACAQIIPWIESIYMWNNQLETTQESKVLMKTHLDKWEKVKQVILENHSYEVPEITYIPIEGGNLEYLDWIASSTQMETVK